jgi:hypothetical protein
MQPVVAGSVFRFTLAHRSAVRLFGRGGTGRPANLASTQSPPASATQKAPPGADERVIPTSEATTNAVSC